MMLRLVRRFVCDQFKLTSDRHEPGIRDSLMLCEAACAFYLILNDEMKYVHGLVRRPGSATFGRELN